MAASPRWKIFDSEGQYQASAKDIGLAAMIVTFLGDGATIRDGPPRQRGLRRGSRVKEMTMEEQENAELRRKLSTLEAELMHQTGCAASEIEGVYRLPISKPVVNARMGDALRARFAAEDQAKALLDTHALLVAALTRLCAEARETVGFAGSLSRQAGGRFAERFAKFDSEILQAEQALAAAKGEA